MGDYGFGYSLLKAFYWFSVIFAIVRPTVNPRKKSTAPVNNYLYLWSPKTNPRSVSTALFHTHMYKVNGSF
jgi:hypothetical protein